MIIDEKSVISDYYELRSAPKVADKYKCSRRAVYNVLKKNKVECDGNPNPRKFTDDQLVDLLEQGLNFHQISVMLGCHETNVGKHARRLGYKSIEKTYERNAKVKECTGGRFDFVDYISKNKYKIRCNKCLFEFERDLKSINDNTVRCPQCYEKELSNKSEQKEKIKLIRRFATVIQPRECEVCGEVFHTSYAKSKFCSDICRKRSKYHKDRRVTSDNLVDKNITLKKLYRRDKGICYLCGCETDFLDIKYTNDGIRYIGDRHPVKEHVVPLARGGKESWENCRLACNLCNSKKGAMLLPEYKNYILKREDAFVNPLSGAKRTAQYSLDGELIKIYDSTSQVQRELGFNCKTIQNVCRGKGRTAFGYKWEYISEE